MSAPVIKKKPKPPKTPKEPKQPKQPKVPKEKTNVKAKAKKDPNAPKKALSAFMFFSKANRNRIVDENEGCSFGEVGKYLGEEWKSVTGS